MAKKRLKYGSHASSSSSLVMLVVRMSLFFCRTYSSRAAVLGQTVDGLMAFVGLLYSEHSTQGEIV